MIDVRSTLEEILELGASDIFVEADLPLAFRSGQTLQYLNNIRLQAEDAREFTDALYLLAGDRQEDRLIKTGDDVFSFTVPEVARFRVSAFSQRGRHSAILRVIPDEIPSPEELGIPVEVMELAALRKGLVTVTGEAGSGKTTTLACLVEAVNQSRACHILTLEDPIEFLHPNRMSIVTQRELHTDTESFSAGLLAAMRQNPEVILLGSLEEPELIPLCNRAVGNGILVFAEGSAGPGLSGVLEAVVHQKLTASEEGGLVPEITVEKNGRSETDSEQ